MTVRLLCAALLFMPALCAAYRVEDDDRATIELAGPAQRIVSLAPGATAMLFAAGAGGRIVGTSAYSDEPAAAQKIERIGDAQSLDLERILALHPDVVVVWTGGTSLTEIARLQRVGLRIYHHHVTRLEQMPDSLKRLGVLTGTQSEAAAAANELAGQIASLRSQYSMLSRASVFIQVWDKPLYTVGKDEIITDVIHMCGYRSTYDDLSDVSPAVTIESVLARDPDVILALDSDPKSPQHWLLQWHAFGSMRAVRTGHLLAWSDPRLIRMGPSEVEAAATLCKALHTVNAK
ncbi:MAG TPA: cobalamin-binding protein [Steroidobacteraceae bacterium]|jgi:iron complex transport system substrate-binding protein|nr:cobalamin-binding protein [Steroidobacteraceae bacterium]